MQVGIIGLGRMGGGIARRLMRGGHRCVVYDRDPKAVAEVTRDGASGAEDVADLVRQLAAPRTLWVMLPAGAPTEETIKAAGEAAKATARPIDDMRGSIRQRKHLAGVLVERTLRTAAERARA
jgi:6-phosphogluconate dehydrogenase